jgi:hypothetical protein
MKSAVDDIVSEDGAQGLDNLVLFSGVTADHPGEFVAQDTEIAEMATRLDAVERLLKLLVPSGATLAQEAQFAGQFLKNIDPSLLAAAAANYDWLQGFLAAALHDVSIDMESGVVRIGKSLEIPVADLTSLKPTG